MKGTNYLLAFIGGAAVGAAVGLLYAPQKGSELRKKIAESLRKRGIRLSKVDMSELVDEIAEQFDKKEEGLIEE